MKKLISTIICLLILVTVFSGCGQDDGFVTTLELDSKVKTLDPQLASTLEDKILVKNLYEGLMREDENGNIVLGCAEDYDIKDSGKTYTFTLRDKLFWNDETPLTAYDFEFAFKRALSKVTNAPYSYLLNDVSSFTAKNEKVFEIRLARKNDDFLKTLCKSICMPCNENFFNKAKGKYGLDPKFVLTNGSFYLKKWNKEGEYLIKISENEQYNGTFKPKALSINISLGDINERESRLEKEYVEFGFANYTCANKKSDKVSYINNYNTAYMLLINKKGILESRNMRKAIEKSINRSYLEEKLPKSFSNAIKFIPPSIKINNKEISKIINSSFSKYSPKSAGNYYRMALNEKPGSNLYGSSIIYFKDENIQNLAKNVAETWQQTIDGYVNIKEFEDYSEFSSALYSKTYDFAIIPISTIDNDIYEYFSQININNARYKSTLKRLKNANNDKLRVSYAKILMRIIKSEKTYIPLVFTSTVLGASKKYDIPKILPENGYIDFALIKEK